ncbi:MAG: von Willebrand factor type A domain-containing protein [Anaerolineae bacterium]|nr:von Willebrand factor type A domain-containing protein [Anaerolineae bacterium]
MNRRTLWLLVGLLAVVGIVVLAVVLAGSRDSDDSGGETQRQEKDEQTAQTSTLSTPSPPSTMTQALIVPGDADAADELAFAEEYVADSGVVDGLPAEPAVDGQGAAANAPGAVSATAVGMVQPQGTPAPDTESEGTPVPPDDMFFEDYGVNPFLDTDDDRLSTFAMDVDTASYTLVRSYLMDYEQLPPPEVIRSEEMINYFDVDYENPGGDDAFSINLDAAPAPFGYEGHYLLRVGLQGRYIAPEDRDPALLIFVIDVSGSMDRGDRLELVKKALDLLVGELREDDRVGIVVYSENSRVVLDPTPASNTDTILNAIHALRPEGSTNVADGLRLAYDLAQKNRRDEGITRLVVLSDGVANVDVTGPDEILNLVRDSVEDGITLSTIGFGMGNFNDVLMEQLANDGNGNYYYVDTLREARRIFVHNLTGTLQVIGYDAKVQVDFDPAVTDRYRLIGYENRAIADEDFRDDTVDAGEVGAGHSITALYELALEEGVSEGVVATVYIRYQDADTREVVEVSRDITVDDLLPSIDDAAPDFRLLAAAAEFSELLRESYWAQDGSYAAVLDLAKPLLDDMPGNEEVAEFVELVRLAGRYVDR